MSELHNHKVRVALLARWPVMCAGLRHLLEQHESVDVVAEYRSTSEAITASDPCDVILLDPDCEEISLRAVSALAQARDSRILVFTGASDVRVHTRAIELGAAGVLSKEQQAGVVVRAVLKVHAGELWLERAKTAAVLSWAMRRGQDPEVMKIGTLTKREREIVGLVGEGLRNSAIAERLFISEATVRNHLTSILSKLELVDRFDLAVYAFRHELVPSLDVQTHRAAPLPVDDAPSREAVAVARPHAPVRPRPTARGGAIPFGAPGLSAVASGARAQRS